MPDLIRCDFCAHDPGSNRVCDVAKRHAYRAWRRCAHYRGVDAAQIQAQLTAERLAQATDSQDQRLSVVCGDCQHRSPTAMCRYWSNKRKEINRVPADLACGDCHGFSLKQVVLQS